MSGDKDLLDQAAALVVSAGASGGLSAIPADVRGTVLQLAVRSGNSTAFDVVRRAYLKVGE
jgi:hypothetical protein